MIPQLQSGMLPGMRLRWPTLPLVLLLALVPAVHAVAGGVKARHQILTVLRDGNYAALDAAMNAVQQDYRGGTVSDVALVRQFGAFARTDQELAGLLDGWVQAYPDSYAAHLARGAFYFRCGVAARGMRYASRTTEAQLAGMRLYLGKARADLEASLALDPKPLASYRYLIIISRMTGDKGATRALASNALALDPDSIMIRRPYMVSLETRWGGSLEEMLAFRAESAGTGASAEHLQALDELIAQERQWLAETAADVEDADPAD